MHAKTWHTILVLMVRVDGQRDRGDRRQGKTGKTWRENGRQGETQWRQGQREETEKHEETREAQRDIYRMTQGR